MTNVIFSLHGICWPIILNNFALIFKSYLYIVDKIKIVVDTNVSYLCAIATLLNNFIIIHRLYPVARKEWFVQQVFYTYIT